MAFYIKILLIFNFYHSWVFLLMGLSSEYRFIILLFHIYIDLYQMIAITILHYFVFWFYCLLWKNTEFYSGSQYHYYRCYLRATVIFKACFSAFYDMFWMTLILQSLWHYSWGVPFPNLSRSFKVLTSLLSIPNSKAVHVSQPIVISVVNSIVF